MRRRPMVDQGGAPEWTGARVTNAIGIEVFLVWIHEPRSVVERIRDLIPMRRLSLNSESANEHSQCELRQNPIATTIDSAEEAIQSHRFFDGRVIRFIRWERRIV